MGRRRRRSAGRTLHGVLLIDKPAGPTSFKVVDRVRRALDVAKAGHTGTLDPFATGLLVLCLDRATPLVAYLTSADKRYRAEIELGVATDTYDCDGEVQFRADDQAIDAVDAAMLEAAMVPLRGQIEQRPPAYSAIKVDGERLYAKARRGEVVEAPLRSVNVLQFELIKREGRHLTCDVHCTKGTYVRSLAHDLGQALGVGAHLSGLRRITVGPFKVDDAIGLETLEADPSTAVGQALTMTQATAHYRTLITTESQANRIKNGQPVVVLNHESGIWRAIEPSGRLLAMLEISDSGSVKILRGFATVPLDGS